MARSVHLIPLAISLGAAGPGAAVAADTGLVTGAVVYNLTLEDESGLMGGLTGSMSALLTRDCNTYRTETTLTANFEGPAGTIPMTMSSAVSEDADSLAFDISGQFASVEIERAEGTATRTADGVAVSLSAPGEETRNLDGDIVFPLAMIQASVEAAKAGESLVDFVVYDGSGHGRDVWLVSVVISPSTDPGGDSEEALFAAGLGFADMPRWQMVFSYFPQGASGDQTPSFSSRAVVYENGFVQAASYDFGEFAMRLTLDEFSPIPAKPCQ